MPGGTYGADESTPEPHHSRGRLRQIAEEVRRHGYAVSVDAAIEQMPVERAWLHVDLIAARGDEHVLVLIGLDDGQVRVLAGVVGAIAGWRLDHHHIPVE